MTTPQIATHVDFASWDQPIQALVQGRTSRIWRGQGDYDWKLTTGLARKLKIADPDKSRDWIQAENSVIGYFMDQVGGLLDAIPDEHDLLAWLSLMQHYGALTRLLDWSLSPFVAIYFAYEQLTERDSALYSLDYYLARRINVTVLFPMPWDYLGVVASSSTDSAGQTTTRYPTEALYRRDRENEVLRWAMRTRSKCPLPAIPLRQDARMSAQQTILTLMGDLGVEIDDWFDKDKWVFPESRPGGMLAGTDSTIWPLEQPGQLLQKIRLRPEWRNQALQSLEMMGITASSLFPGLDGIGRAATSHLMTGALTTRDVLTGWLT